MITKRRDRIKTAGRQAHSRISKFLPAPDLASHLLHFNMESAGRYTQALCDLGIKTLSAPEWTSINAVVEAFGPRSDVMLLYRAPVASSLFDFARRVAPSTKILFHPVDLHFLRTERQAALTGDQAMADSAAAMRALELDLIRRADATIVVSTYEYHLLYDLLPGAAIHQIPILREGPSRHRYYRRILQSKLDTLGRWFGHRNSSLEKRRDFLFIGGYEHLPNVDAVQWFVREVWPQLQSRGFPHRFIIAGSNVPSEIAALASNKIEVRGHVKNLAPMFESCRLSIAPLRYGGGIKGKIVTSLSYGVPVVATSIAVEGMELRHEESVLIADSPNVMADQIIRLYDDVELWHRVSSKGYQAFQGTYSIAAGSKRLLCILDDLVALAAR